MDLHMPQNVIARPLELFLLLSTLPFSSYPFFLTEIMVNVIIASQSRLWCNFSHIIYFVCINFIHLILFKIDSERQIFEKIYRANLFTIRRKSPEEYFFIFCFNLDVCHGVWIGNSCQISQQTTYWTPYLYLARI